MSRITVNAGDCIDSIAYGHGMLWKSIWNHPENQELKQRRKDPNVLAEGDEVFVPEIELRDEDAATESMGRQLRKGLLRDLPRQFQIRHFNCVIACNSMI